MKITFMGTGTSVGVPIIGCNCRVCLSTDPHNKRRRTSLYVQAAGQNVVVDTPPDFRDQALQYHVLRVDAVLFTHSHADHIFGFDDVRRFNTMQGGVIPAYGSHSTIKDLRRIFDYVHSGEVVEGTYRPQIDFIEVTAPFSIGEIRVEPVPVLHGPKPTFGYLIKAEGKTLCYVPDCSKIEDDSIARLRGIDVMILDALRHKPHTTHMSVAESAETLRRIGARKSFMIHMGHDVDHEEVQKAMPGGIFLSYDGLVVEW